MSFARAAVLLFSLLMVFRLHAQPAGSLDTNFVAVAGTDVAPIRLAPLPDGRLYVGGLFTNYGGAGKAAVARLLANGQVDAGFTLPPLRQVNPAIILNGRVLVPASTNVGQLSALLALPDGRAVIGGTFTDIGGTPARRLALLAQDGTPAETSFPLNDLEPQPFALLNGPAGTFYVGNKGNLTSGRLPLLRLKLDGSLDDGFTPPTLAELGYQSANPFTLLRGPGDSIYAITAAAVNSAPASDILRLTSSGALDLSFAGTGKAKIPFANISSFVTDPAGRLTFVNVTSYRGTALTRWMNRLNLDGTLDATFQPTVNPGQSGRVVAAQADGKVLFTGGDAPINRLNNDGTLDKGYVDPGKVPVKQSFLSLVWFVPAPDGSLFGAGFTFSPTFQILNGAYHILGDPNSAPTIAVEPAAQTNTFGARTRFFVTAQGAAPFSYQWFRNGTLIGGATGESLVLEPTTAADSNAEFHCVVSNGQGSTPSAKARLTLFAATPGSVYRESDAPVGTDGAVTDLQWDTGGRLVAAGYFTKFHGTNRIRVARLIDEGRLVDPTFEPTGINSVGMVEDILPLSSGRLLAMGNFGVTYGGVQHTGSMRLLSDGALDTSFNPTGVGSRVGGERFSEAPDGRLFVSVSSWNDTPLPSHYGRLSADGVRDATFVPSPAFQPTHAILALPDGRVLVGGYTNVQNPVLNGSGVLRLNADGTQDPTFFRGQFAGVQRPSVTALLRQSDGKILVAGSFSEMSNGVERFLGVIRLLENGQLDPSFNPVPALSAMNFGPVQGLALQADGRILIQGGFTALGGYPRPGLARLWPNGVIDPDFSPGLPKGGIQNGSVASVAVSPANNVFVGGAFQQFDAVPRTNFVRLNGGPLQPVPAPPTIVSQPTRVVAKAGSSITFTVEPGGSGPFQFQWRRNVTRGSSTFFDLAGETNASLTLSALRYGIEHDSGLFEVKVVNPGGAVTSQLITLLVEPDPVVSGTVDGSFAGVAVNGLVSSQPQVTAPAPGGLLYASQITKVVRLFEDGTPDPGFLPPADLTMLRDGGVSAIKRQSDGKLLVAGRLKDGALARLLPDGSYDPDFIRTNSYTGFAQGVVWEIGLQSDGKIILAGTFENFAGRTVNGLIRLQPNGAVDPSFPLTAVEAVLSNPVRVLPGTVVSLRVLDDDRIYIGGGFNRVHGVTRVGVARLNADGSLDSSFVPPANAATPLGQGGTMLFYTLGPVTPDGGVYVFGTFRPTPDGPVTSALRLFLNGTVDSSFNVSTDFQINFGTVQGDGKLIVTGQFTKLNGQNRAGFARLNTDGSTDAGFAQGATFGVGGPMSILPDGKLLIAGTRFFTGVGPALPAEEIDFVLKPGGLELTWPPGFQLQKTLSLSPASWQNVANPSPFTVPLSGPGEFFRVVPTP